jgi:hypothetical protein
MVRKRRGIGNVIATAVMVFFMVFTASQLYLYSIDQLDNYNQVAQTVYNTNAQKQSEHIAISNLVLDSSGTLSNDYIAKITVSNNGGVTSNIVAVWVDNVDQSTQSHSRISENVFIGQGLSATLPSVDMGILKTALVKMTIKVLTALGNSVSTEVLPPGLAGTTSQTLANTLLTLIPPNPITSNDMTVSLTVTNTNSLGVAFTALAPDVCFFQGDFNTGTAIPPVLSTVFSGTGASGTAGSNILTVNPNPNWTPNQWLGNIVVVTGGTGAGQTGRITSNGANTLTVSFPSPQTGWTTSMTSSTFAIQSDCHGKNVTVYSGVAVSGTSNTLVVSGSPWLSNEWNNYFVVITAGTGSGQTATITGTTFGNTITVTPNWTINPGSGSQFSIQAPNCSAGTGTTTAAPVSCTLVQGPTPSNFSFLPSGGSVQFQWTYLLNSIVANAPVTFVASYTNMSTTIGLISSSQAPAQLATVRPAGGTSSGLGGQLGNLAITFSTFQYTQDGANWVAAFSMPQGVRTILSVVVNNLGPTSFALDQDTVLYLNGLTTGSTTVFFVIQPSVCNTSNPPNWFSNPPADSRVCSYPGTSNPIVIPPSGAATVYFGANNPGSTHAQRSPPPDIYAVTLSQTGESGTLTTGTVLSSTRTSLTVAGNPWTPGQWVGKSVEILSGSGASSFGTISVSTSNAITISGGWQTNPPSGSTFAIGSATYGQSIPVVSVTTA